MVGRIPKREVWGIDGIGREADASAAVFFIRVISQEHLGRYLFTLHASFLPSGRTERIERPRKKEEAIGILKN